jgi:2-polyprenyl-6-methoxyphenol hydroxylase-like FAD-dependent oxidoreductase
MSKLKILVVGAGLGGLCLAQTVRRADVDVQVFERDASPWDRPQGYRLHLDADGVTALRVALPRDLYALFEATSMQPLPYTTVVDTGLLELRRFPSDEHGSTQSLSSADHAPSHVNVNRATLRQILLAGLDGVCQFGRRLVRYETDAEGVTAVFADGSKVRGDILVGADGIRSAVRKQLVPDARTVDTGVRAIYGRIPIEHAKRIVPSQALADVFTIAADARKVFLGLGPVVFPARPEVASGRLFPQARLRKQDDYVVCIVGGRREYFGSEDSTLRQADSAELQNLAVDMLRNWPAVASAIPAHGDPTSFFFVEMDTSVPCEVLPYANVTLLGDAIHAMTPTLGRGANVAMRDAAWLGRSIIAAHEGKAGLSEALNACQSEIARYGFDVVRKSAAMGQRLMGQDPLPE